jgi:DNA processing protein
MSLQSWLTLSLTNGLGPVLTRRLIDRVGSIDAVLDVSQTTLRSIEGIGNGKAFSIHQSLIAAKEEAKKELGRAAAANVRIVSADDDEYPALLKLIPAPPLVLYVRGTLEPRDLQAVAIVGSRKCSVYGREQAERFGANLAGVGVTVVSGGARGIDTHAHKGALVPKNGRTIAVLGCGVDQAYPPENRELFAKIAEQGAIVSEFPLGTPPNADNFPRRNRIVSGLSRGVIVVEADVKSGALITSRYAVEDHQRPVFAIPGRIDNPLSAGPHKLIRDGAVLVETLSDILDNLGPVPEGVRAPTPEPTLFSPEVDAKPRAVAPSSDNLVGLTDRQSTILTAMGSDVLDVDSISERSSIATQFILQELTMMTLRGAVQRVEGQRYVRRK